MKKISTVIKAAILMAAFMGADDIRSQRFQSAADTIKVNEIIRELAEPGAKAQGKVLPVAEKLIGTPYGETTQNDSVGTVCVNLSEVDDIDFLNTVVAMAKTLTSPNPRWREYAAQLQNVSRRRGEDKGFISKMIYGGDWVVDNVYRGNIQDLTEYGDNPNFKTKSLEYVTRNRDRYKALADSATYEDMRMVEMGFRTHKIPHMKKEWASDKNLTEDMHDGDIIMFLTNEPDKDVYLIGVVKKEADGPHLIYPSAVEGKVIEDENVLSRHIKKETKRIYGWRWLRLKD